MAKDGELVISAVQNERYQAPETRRSLFAQLDTELARPVVTLFTSFRYLASIDDADLSVLEGLLRKLDTSRGIAIMINSPGGSGLSAERMIHLLRSYSGTGEYWAIVPGQAKSAATMVCLGASKIIMGPASELGPIDPQVWLRNQYISIHHVIDSYHKLFRGSRSTKGRVEPYLQQLEKYDAREIGHLENQRDLSTDIAIRCLESGMMKGRTARQIKSSLQVFLEPGHLKTHGRPIYAEEAKKCGLKIATYDAESVVWGMIYELYVRTSEFVSHGASKAVETGIGSFYMRPSEPEGEE